MKTNINDIINARPETFVEKRNLTKSEFKIVNDYICQNKIFDIGYDLYYKPRYNKHLKQFVPPNSNQIITAIANQNDECIVLTGNSLLNALGLSTQVPTVIEIATSGKTRRLLLKNTYQIQFTHDDICKQYRYLSENNKMIIEAINILSKENVNISDDIIQTLSKSTSFVETQLLIKNSFLFNEKLIAYVCLIDENLKP